VSHRHRANSNRRDSDGSSGGVDDAHTRSAVRVIPRDLVPAALAAAGRTPAGPRSAEEPAVLRPRRFEDIADVVDPLRAQRRVVLELDGLDNQKERRRVMDFVAGVACGLETTVASIATKSGAFLLEPRTERGGRRHHGLAPTATSSDPHDVESSDETALVLCVLCDLRPADDTFDSPLDMVIKRDGSRMWSPPASVCARCRDTIQHWRFVLGWCPECERWGRRSVMSACGIPYGT
jgi:Cell division protein SepF